MKISQNCKGKTVVGESIFNRITGLEVFSSTKNRICFLIYGNLLMLSERTFSRTLPEGSTGIVLESWNIDRSLYIIFKTKSFFGKNAVKNNLCNLKHQL